VPESKGKGGKKGLSGRGKGKSQEGDTEMKDRSQQQQLKKGLCRKGKEGKWGGGGVRKDRRPLLFERPLCISETVKGVLRKRKGGKNCRGGGKKNCFFKRWSQEKRKGEKNAGNARPRLGGKKKFIGKKPEQAHVQRSKSEGAQAGQKKKKKKAHPTLVGGGGEGFVGKVAVKRRGLPLGQFPGGVKKGEKGEKKKKKLFCGKISGPEWKKRSGRGKWHPSVAEGKCDLLSRKGGCAQRCSPRFPFTRGAAREGRPRGEW